MKKENSKLYIVMYHYTRDLIHSRYPKIKGLDIGLFRQQMEFFKKNYSVVRMEQVFDAMEGRGDLPSNAVLLTFDDGYIDNYTYAFPILEEFGFQGSFFIPGKTFSMHELLDVNKIHFVLASTSIHNILTDAKVLLDKYRGEQFDYPTTEELWNQYAQKGRYDDEETVFIKKMLQTALPEKLRNRISSELFRKYVGISEEQLAYELYMTPDQIRSLKRHDMFIGIHGYDHYWLGNLSTKQMKHDINRALDTMGDFIDREKWAINYPYGSYNNEVISYAQEMGACVGFSTKVGVAKLCNNNAMELPRLNCNDFPPKSENYIQIEEENKENSETK